MTSPYAPPPAGLPEALPPNRPRARPARALASWFFLIVLFVAMYRFAARDPLVPDPDAPAAPASPPLPAWPLALAPATLAACALAFQRIRARLPASLRTGALREQAAPKPERGAPAPFGELTLRGRDGTGRMEVTIDDAGLRLRRKAGLVRPAQELEIDWGELQHISAGARGGTLAVWGLAIAFLALFYWLQAGGPAPLPVGLAGLGIAAADLLRARGVLSLVTETHRVEFASRQLVRPVRERILAAARERCPSAAPPLRTTGLLRGLWFLHGRQVQEVRALFSSDEALRRELEPPKVPLTDEERAAGAVQRRLVALWSASFLLFLPLSLAATAGALVGPIAAVVVFYASLFAGLMVSSRWLRTLARLAGLTLLR